MYTDNNLHRGNASATALFLVAFDLDEVFGCIANTEGVSNLYHRLMPHSVFGGYVAIDWHKLGPGLISCCATVGVKESHSYFQTSPCSPSRLILTTSSSKPSHR